MTRLTGRHHADLAGSQALAQAGAALGFLLAAVALYTAFALLLEDSRGREVLPIGRLAMARHATHSNLAMQLRDIERQAGVRRTLPGSRPRPCATGALWHGCSSFGVSCRLWWCWCGCGVSGRG
jgi:hypothetical protein